MCPEPLDCLRVRSPVVLSHPDTARTSAPACMVLRLRWHLAAYSRGSIHRYLAQPPLAQTRGMAKAAETPHPDGSFPCQSDDIGAGLLRKQWRGAERIQTGRAYRLLARRGNEKTHGLEAIVACCDVARAVDAQRQTKAVRSGRSLQVRLKAKRAKRRQTDPHTRLILACGDGHGPMAR